jgi:hypothetical protein
MSNVTKPIVEPTLIETLQALKSDVFKNLYCHVPGRIQSFDGSKKTAVIQILFAAQQPDGSTLNYPVLVDCPVFTLQGGGGYIQFPIAAGDPCLVVFADRNIDAWFQNGSPAVPFDQVGGKPGRMHDLSDGMAFVGFNSLADAMPAYQPNKLVMSYAGASIVFQSGQITFDGASGEAQITAIGNFVKIANATTSLLVLLDGLIDVIAAAQLDVTHAVLAGSTITALEAYKLQLAGLLQ